MNAKLKLASAVVLSVFLTACGSTPKAPVEPIKISSQVKTFTISNEFGEVSKSDIAKALTANIYANTAYDAYGNNRHSGSTTTSYSYRGLQVAPLDDSNLRLRYMHTDVVDVGSFSSYHDAIFGIEVSQQGDSQKVVITTPAEVIRFDKEVLFVLKVRQIDTTENITNDVLKISDRLNFELSSSKPFKSEITSEYTLDAVFHGLNRKFRLTNVADSNGSRSFSFDANGTQVAAKISPFRNGSILDYSFSLPYTLKSDGTASSSQQQMTEHSEKIKKHIATAI